MNDVRQELSDLMIKEAIAEIDRDTIRRYQLGYRCVAGPTGPEWVYFVDEFGRNVDEKGKLL